MLHGHRRELRDEAAALEAQPGGGGVGRRLGRVGHGPAARHAEVHVHHDVCCLARRAGEEREEVLADRLAAAEGAAVDELRALAEPAVGRGRAVRAADEPARVLRGNAVDRVALDHGASDEAREARYVALQELSEGDHRYKCATPLVLALKPLQGVIAYEGC